MPLFGKNGYVLEGFLTTCSFDYIHRDLFTRSFHLALFIGGFCVPFSVFIFFYMLTYAALKSKGRVIRNTYKYVKKSSVTNGLTNHTSSNIVKENIELYESLNFNTKPRPKYSTSSQKNSECLILSEIRFNNFLSIRENKLAKSISLIFFCFCFAWIPYAIITLIAQFGNDTLRHYITPWTTAIPSLFAKFSSIYNPIIYFLTNNDCKKYFKKRFLLKTKRIQSKNAQKTEV